MTADLYETLGVARDATPDEVKAAYRRAASAAHPDRHGGSTEDMQAVNAAYDTLRDPVLRAAYDADGSTAGVKGLDTLAEDFLEAMFSRAIDEGREPVSSANASVQAGLRDALTQVHNAMVDIAKFEKKLGRTKTKRGRRNLVELILQRRIERARGLIAQGERAQLVANRAIEILADYEGESVDPFAGMTDLQRKQQGHALGIANT